MCQNLSFRGLCAHTSSKERQSLLSASEALESVIAEALSFIRNRFQQKCKQEGFLHKQEVSCVCSLRPVPPLLP